MKREIDLSKPGIYVVSGGEIHRVDMPETGFGSNIITWQNGKVVTIKSESVKKV